jgi:hypothetical protein
LGHLQESARIRVVSVYGENGLRQFPYPVPVARGDSLFRLVEKIVDPPLHPLAVHDGPDDTCIRRRDWSATANTRFSFQGGLQ